MDRRNGSSAGGAARRNRVRATRGDGGERSAFGSATSGRSRTRVTPAVGTSHFPESAAIADGGSTQHGSGNRSSAGVWSETCATLIRSFVAGSSISQKARATGTTASNPTIKSTSARAHPAWRVRRIHPGGVDLPRVIKSMVSLGDIRALTAVKSRRPAPVRTRDGRRSDMSPESLWDSPVVRTGR